MEKIEKAFKECNLKFLDKAFGLEEVDSLPALTDWLSIEVELSDMETQFLIYIRQILDFNVHDWNEYELDSHFIGPMFTLVNFSSKKFNHYSQRLIRGIVGDYELYGKPDGMIATGRREPEHPYFAFQEYKRELDPYGDPAGQTLAAMLVGQALNENQLPIYGCYVSGQSWFFIVYENNQYCITPAYSALTDDIFEIFKLLKALKEIVKIRSN
jgi:hypothetical protein